MSGREDVDMPGSLVAVGDDKQPSKQTTPKGLEIDVPTREDFDALVRKTAGPPAGRKRPAETDPPPAQSE